MSRFEMAAHQPEKIQFELKAVLTIEEWRKVSDALKGCDVHGPAYWLRDAIGDMIQQANKDYRAWPEGKE